MNNNNQKSPLRNGLNKPKYKCLTADELQNLEKEFINFLASAQITGSDWEKMKKDEVEKVEELIAVFSDLVYEKVLSKIKFLEYRDTKTLNILIVLMIKLF